MRPSLKPIAAGALLGGGIVFTVLALLAFTSPFIGTLSGDYEGGRYAFASFLFYLLFAVPAAGAIAAAISIRGRHDARVGYFTLFALFGIPLVIVIAALLQWLYDALRR